MPNKEDQMGALWAKETREGAVYFKGNVEIDGAKHEVVIFKNGYKDEGSNQPDYRIYRSRPKEA